MIEIATIVKPQGIKGEIKAVPSTNVVEVFDVIKECLVGGKVMHVKNLSFRQGFLYIKFAEINSRNEAENYRNLTIKNNLAMNYFLYLAKLQAFQKHFLPYAYIVVLYLLKRLSLISGFIQFFSSPILLSYISLSHQHIQCVNYTPFFSKTTQRYQLFIFLSFE